MTARTPYLILALLACVTSFAQQAKTVINGMAPGAEHKMVRLSASSDLITNRMKTLATTRVDSTGHFSLSTITDQTIFATISIDLHDANLFLEPSKSYEVSIAPMKYDDYTEVNPLIQSQALTLDMVNPDPQELNSLVSVFNAIYSGFLVRNFNALYRERNKVLLDTFRVQLNRQFGAQKNGYFLDYATYKMASLEQLAQYYTIPQLARKYFSASPILYQNTEYMEFFNSFFSKYLTSVSGTLRKTDYVQIIKGKDAYGTMMKAIAADTLLKNEQLRELVMLRGLMEMYNTTGQPQEEIVRLIASVKERSKFNQNKEVAANMIFQLTRLKPGSDAPGFKLMNRQQTYTSLPDLRGKPVLLGFWNINCEGCLSEMDLLKPLFDKYGEKMHIVSISADKYFSQMLFFINLKKEYVWTFLNIGDQSEVLVDYDVRSYPLFVLLDREGRIFRYPADFPSAGLEKDIDLLLKE